MKRYSKIDKLINAVLVLAITFCFLTGCNDSFVRTHIADNSISESSIEPSFIELGSIEGAFDCQRPYHFDIETTLDNYPSDGRFPIYTFNRPIFEETSEFAREINQVFIQAEEELRTEMLEEEELYRTAMPKDLRWDPNFPWKHTVLCECTYEESGIVSFVLKEEWYMGGVRNMPLTGYTFDFNVYRQLVITDVLYGNEEQIISVIENEFLDWCERNERDVPVDESVRESIRTQSGLNANFYLSEEGVHIFYEPYTLNATQGGINLLIPWSRTDIVKQL